MSKEHFLQRIAEAYEQVIAAALQAGQRGCGGEAGMWGPREIIAHMAGWEMITAVCLPRVLRGVPPVEFAEEARQTLMDDAINAALVTMAGDQSLEALCDMLRRAYQSTLEFLRTLDEGFFRPGEYVYERSQGIVDHCLEHQAQLAPTQS